MGTSDKEQSKYRLRVDMEQTTLVYACDYGLAIKIIDEWTKWISGGCDKAIPVELFTPSGTDKGVLRAVIRSDAIIAMSIMHKIEEKV